MVSCCWLCTCWSMEQPFLCSTSLVGLGAGLIGSCFVPTTTSSRSCWYPSRASSIQSRECCRPCSLVSLWKASHGGPSARCSRAPRKRSGGGSTWPGSGMDWAEEEIISIISTIISIIISSTATIVRRKKTSSAANWPAMKCSEESFNPPPPKKNTKTTREQSEGEREREKERKDQTETVCVLVCVCVDNIYCILCSSVCVKIFSCVEQTTTQCNNNNNNKITRTTTTTLKCSFLYCVYVCACVCALWVGGLPTSSSSQSNERNDQKKKKNYKTCAESEKKERTREKERKRDATMWGCVCGLFVVVVFFFLENQEVWSVWWPCGSLIRGASPGRTIENPCRKDCWVARTSPSPPGTVSRSNAVPVQPWKTQNERINEWSTTLQFV